MTGDADAILAKYVGELTTQLASGMAAEHAYRPALQRLMESVADITAVNDPKRSEHGAPDFVFQTPNTKLILGWAEAKDIDADLDKAEKSEQLQRYSGYANLFLTNYREFRFYSSGVKYAEVSVGDLHSGAFVPSPETFAMLASELQSFLARPPQPITSGQRLAEVMGGVGVRIRTAVQFYLAEESERNEELMRIYELIKRLLVHDLDSQQFADMYAQTLVYGLFAARYNDPTKDDFSRSEARELVPKSNPFLRQFFDHIAGANFDFRLGRIVDELCAIFAASDVKELVHRHLIVPQFEGMGEDDRDPIMHFYEDFLRAYDPDQRKRLGAFYTPLPVVRFLVNAVDSVLKTEFGLPAGLADTSRVTVPVLRQGKTSEESFHRVQVLDPAVGTATFLNEILKVIHARFDGQEGRWPAYAREDLIPRLNGFELMMAPYTIAHLKLGLTLSELGVSDFGRRLGVYLTNTLEAGLDQPQDLFQQVGLAGAVTHEAVEAGAIKSERPIMVVIGNPPYSAISSNETDFANALVDKFKVEPGGAQKLQERKHWLNDDYVKFLAFAEEMIKRSGAGIVAMITNNGYLDNPTFRGMRWHLQQTFDQISVVDLHGSTNKKELAPDGSKDENVFDIQQGVSIVVGVKLPDSESKELATVDHGELFGRRKKKFQALDSGEIEMTRVAASPPMHYFVPRDSEGEDEYLSGISVDELMPIFSTGIVTMGDGFILSQSRDKLATRVSEFLEGKWDEPALKAEFGLGKNYAGWAVENRASLTFDEGRLRQIDYRPFDSRWIYFDPKLVWRPRSKVMNHMLDGSNVGLVVPRLIKEQPGAFISHRPIGHKLFSAYDSNSLFPLHLFEPDGSKRPNISSEAHSRLFANLNEPLSTITTLDYVYGCLYSPAYREKFAEFLRTDFPRIPIPNSQDEAEQVADIGGTLRRLHLMDAPAELEIKTTFPAPGSNGVERFRRDGTKVWINDQQFFDGVTDGAWQLFIGGYQPAQKWLKDRRGQILSNSEIEYFQQVIEVLSQTAALSSLLDASVMNR